MKKPALMLIAAMLILPASALVSSCAGPAYRADNRQDHRGDRQEGRQDHRDHRQDSRQDRW